ncbi:MAG: DNA gyrase subunit A [Patescibacteria group bacterium UBA2163]
MARKKNNETPEEIPQHTGVIEHSIVEEMRSSYLDYAMSVITSRAIPDVRDGLKPVHRRILFTMHELNLNPGGKTRKSAKITGDVTGNYHPHGDAAVYDSLAKMAQDFTFRYPLVIGQGNFGSIDGDAPAAPRYTEAKMSRVAVEMLQDIEKETVAWRPNYEGTRKEPIVLPSVLPNLLLNGTLGIAVGMATNIPPHNLGELIDATVHLADNPKASIDDLMEFIKGPDFPMGGIAYNIKDIAQAYATGRGSVVVRGETDITEDNKGNPQIVISSIPYRVNKADLIVKIADLVRDKKLDGIKDLRDESTKDIRVVIDLKSSAQPQAVLNYLYKHTQLEDSFHFNMVTLVDGVPQTLSLDGILSNFIEHRKEVVKRRTEFDLRKAQDREHILLGLKKALDHIDEIIALIKKAKDVPTAHAELMKKFKFSDRQTTAILEMRLSKLAGLERKKIEEELKEVQSLIKELESILKSPAKMLTVIKNELKAVGEKHGDERRTKIVKGGVKSMSMEDLIPDEPAMMTLTNNGYIKRTNPSEYKKQKRGGVGVVDLSTKDEDFVTRFVEGSTHDAVLLFTDKGKVYRTRMYDIPEGRRATKGKSVMNVLPLSQEEHVTSVVIVPNGKKKDDSHADSFMLVTQHGVVKKVGADHFEDVRKSGIIAIKLADDDRLIAALPVSVKESVSLVTAKGQSIRFKESDVRVMGRTAAGVCGIKVGKGDYIIGADVVRNEKESYLLVVTDKGYGKRTPVSEYKLQKRAGSGIKTANVTAKTGSVIAALIVDETMSEFIIALKNGQVVRTELEQVPILGRATQGVRVMKLRDGDAIAAFVAF